MVQSSANNASSSCSCPIMKDGPEKRPGTGSYNGPSSTKGVIESVNPECELHRSHKKPDKSAADAAVARFLVRKKAELGSKRSKAK